MHAATRALRDQRGVTLVETLIAIGIMATALTMVGLPMFGALRHDEDWRNSISATTTLQRAYNWIAKDIVNTETISVVDGAPAVDNMTLDWHDLDGTPHTAVYSLNGSDLLRSVDSVDRVVARNVASVSFSRTTNVLAFTLSVYAATGTIDSKTTNHFLKSLQ